jgi:hypothetical protein
MTCIETFATIRIFSASIDPTTIGEVLAIEATDMIPMDPLSKYRARRETNLWKWCTQHRLNSADNMLHIAAALEVLGSKQAELERLRSAGCKTDLCCYWVSTGQGGPSLDVATMKELARLGLPIWWDVYFERDAGG